MSIKRVIAVPPEQYQKIRLLAAVRSKTITDVVQDLIGDKLDVAVDAVPKEVRDYFLGIWSSDGSSK
jgi:hypothetical protein